MNPILFEIGGFAVESYLFFYLLGCMVGGVVFYRESQRLGWPLETMLFVMFGCMVGAMIGSVIFSVLFLDFDTLPQVDRFSDLLGRTVIGGIAGGFIGVEVTKKIVGYPHSTGDAFAVAIPIGHAIGRVGCFLGGCCFGSATNVPWAIEYPQGSYPYLAHVHYGLIESSAEVSHAVHPAQLYELGFDLALFMLLWRLRDRFKIRGTIFKLYLFSYASYRFIAEFFRGDSPFLDVGLKPVQILLLVVALYYGWRVYTQRELVLPVSDRDVARHS
jgi:phosphatidylglycerol:prolipoprotein diacylglycerol transferase